MKKVLLVIEDYNELLFTEGLLKKVGVDCVGLKTEVGLGDKLLAFNPGVVVVSGYGSGIKPEVVCERVASSTGGSKILLLYRGADPTLEKLEELGVSGALKSPFHPKHLIEALADLTGLDPQATIDKFEKMGIFKDLEPQGAKLFKGDRKSSSEHVKGGGEKKQGKYVDTGDRQERYKNILAQLPEPEQKQMSKESVSSWTQKIRKVGDRAELDKLDEAKREFVRALFKKKDSA